MTLLTADDYQGFPSVEPHHRYPYGDGAQQFGELTLPDSPPPHPVIVLIHGGGYREIYDLRPLGRVVAALAKAGFAVWNIEYRRFGNGGDYPQMFLDVAAAADYLPQIAETRQLDLNRVISMGHSAGGHLALWLAGRRNIERASPLFMGAPQAIHGAVALAPLAHVTKGGESELSSDALLAVMGGAPCERPDAYRNGCPAQLLPLAIPQRIVVGEEDKAMLENARRYTEAACQAGDDAQLIILPGAGHFEIVAVDASEWADVLRATVQLRERLLPSCGDN
ncbi:MAG: alpha/beta hydrolase [Chloroflexota bacterium]|nr:alpha/beta hydrolase [Chloroflexota bacterium]MDE2910524.1 alpha/beta hydrolase [Chloroflexota bacterium]